MSRLSRNLIMFIILMASCASTVALAGRDGGGGTPIELDFVAYGQQIANYLEVEPSTFAGKVTAKKLRKVLDGTQVKETIEDLRVDGAPKVARNFRKKKLILLSGERWTALESGSVRAAIVAHEYFGILGVDNQSAYKLSNEILTDAKLKNYFDTFDVAAGDSVPVGFECKTKYKDDSEQSYGSLEIGDQIGTYVAARSIDGGGANGGDALMVYLLSSSAHRMGLGFGPYSDMDNAVPVTSRVKGPHVRLIVGYGKEFFSFPQKVIFQKDIRVIGPVQESLTFLNGDLEIDCRTINFALKHGRQKAGEK